jgi:hypothetical protein
MINFFRKIRKKLADDNKPLKYMRYAIGEIVLVVIGILIALSINNWNEQVKADKEAKDAKENYLFSIYKDLKNDINAIDVKLNTFSVQYKAGIEVLEVFESKKLKAFDSIRIAYLIGWELTDVTSSERDENTWDGLGVQGNQILIENDSLIDLLNKFYTGFDRLIERFNQLPKKSRMDLRELSSQCHNTKDLKFYYENGVVNYGGVTSDILNCFLSNNILPKLVSTITMTSIVNQEYYMEIKKMGQSILLYMEDNFQFLNENI